MSRSDGEKILNTFVKIIKASAKYAARDAKRQERERKMKLRSFEREAAKRQKEYLIEERHYQKKRFADQKELEQFFFAEGRRVFEHRCLKRAELRNNILKTI